MKILVWTIRIVIAVLLIWFAVKNSHMVDLNGYVDSTLKAPLVLILLAFFGGGLILGLLACEASSSDTAARSPVNGLSTLKTDRYCGNSAGFSARRLTHWETSSRPASEGAEA